MTYTCKFCNAILASEYSLSTHQKKTKKCLIKQGLEIPEGEFKCELCNEKFIHKTVLSVHLISCNKKNILLNYNKLETNYNKLETKYNILLSKYNMILEEKEKLLDKITTAALSKTNNTVKNNINITTYTRTDEELKNIYDSNLTSSHIEGGISAITKLIVDKVVTDDNGNKMITITDKVRGTARYKLSNGENVIDNGLNTFTCKNRDIIMKKIYSIVSNEEIANKILDEDTNISKGYNEISDDLDGSNLRNSLIKSI